MLTATPAQRERWDTIHRFCADDTDCDSLDEARYVLTTHSAHGPGCRQYLAAMRRATGSSI